MGGDDFEILPVEGYELHWLHDARSLSSRLLVKGEVRKPTAGSQGVRSSYASRTNALHRHGWTCCPGQPRPFRRTCVDDARQDKRVDRYGRENQRSAIRSRMSVTGSLVQARVTKSRCPALSPNDRNAAVPGSSGPLSPC